MCCSKTMRCVYVRGHIGHACLPHTCATDVNAPCVVGSPASSAADSSTQISAGSSAPSALLRAVAARSNKAMPHMLDPGCSFQVARSKMLDPDCGEIPSVLSSLKVSQSLSNLVWFTQCDLLRHFSSTQQPRVGDTLTSARPQLLYVARQRTSTDNNSSARTQCRGSPRGEDYHHYRKGGRMAMSRKNVTQKRTQKPL